MKRSKVDILDIVCFSNLVNAAAKAAKGKRYRKEVQAFLVDLESNLIKIRDVILEHDLPCSGLRKFTIYDPKKRLIHAPSFPDRVLHHAIMNYVAPVLERAMVDMSFACREGKGSHAAVKQVQKNIRCYPWYVKIDIVSYFDTIPHHLLLNQLKRRIKGYEVLKIIENIVTSYHVTPARGLPIGALPSQHFANFFLDSLDRYVMEDLKAKAYVRYMDDMIWWCTDKAQAKMILQEVNSYLKEKLLLQVKERTIEINTSKRGVTYCGFRVFPGKIALSQRKKRRYSQIRNKWENLYRKGHISSLKLQSAYDSINSVISHADSVQWRKQQLQRHPAPDC